MAKFELSEKKYKNGRRKFTAVLYELQPPECEDTVNELGTKYNENGITFFEEYAKEHLDSIKDMSVTVEFEDIERTQILGHGLTGIKDGLPVFDNATVIGHFTDGFITDAELDGEMKRVVCGNGTIDEMRYPEFVAKLEEDLNNDIPIGGSIEIFKPDGEDGIVYKYGYKELGRIPTNYIHSGWSIVLNPADKASKLVEISEKNNKEIFEMNEKDKNELLEGIKAIVSELNSVKTESDAKIAELNSSIEEKDAKIVELNATVEQVNQELCDLRTEHNAYLEERKVLEEELAKLKVEKRLSELNEALADYSEDEIKIAEVEINSFKENPVEGDIEAISNKICRGIVEKQKQANKTIEINSKVDLFSDIYSDIDDVEDTDLNIF